MSQQWGRREVGGSSRVKAQIGIVNFPHVKFAQNHVTRLIWCLLLLRFRWRFLWSARHGGNLFKQRGERGRGLGERSVACLLRVGQRKWRANSKWPPAGNCFRLQPFRSAFPCSTKAKGGGGGGGQAAVQIFSVGSLCTRTRRGCRRPLQLWRPFGTRLVAPHSVVNICIRGKSRGRQGEREDSGQPQCAACRSRASLTFVLREQKTKPAAGKIKTVCRLQLRRAERGREREERGEWREGGRESSRLRLAVLWVAAWVSANVLLSKPVQQWQQCHKLSRAFGANSDLATAGDRGVWASWGWAGCGGVYLWRVAAFKCCANVNTNKMLSVCS